MYVFLVVCFLLFSHKSPACIPLLSHARYVLHPSDSPLLHLSNHIWPGVQVKKPLIMQFSPAFHCIVPLRSKYSPKRSVLNVRHQVSHPYKTVDNIVLYVLTFRFKIGDERTKGFELKHYPNLIHSSISSWINSWFVAVVSKYSRIFAIFIRYPYIMILRCILVTRHQLL
jgi:hypothetical protein